MVGDGDIGGCEEVVVVVVENFNFVVVVVAATATIIRLLLLLMLMLLLKGHWRRKRRVRMRRRRDVVGGEKWLWRCIVMVGFFAIVCLLERIDNSSTHLIFVVCLGTGSLPSVLLGRVPCERRIGQISFGVVVRGRIGNEFDEEKGFTTFLPPCRRPN